LERAGSPGLRLSHAVLLRHLDREGTRASVLAERAGLTRQAITQAVDDLERLGYVTRLPDPDDGRAKIVAYTDHGRTAFDASRAIIADLETAYAERVGPRRYATMRGALAELLEQSG
jgi:DNA-binding MarR family transcriptional regulator